MHSDVERVDGEVGAEQEMTPIKQEWEAPAIVMERSLVARADDPFVDPDQPVSDPFLGPLNAPPGT